MPEPASSNCASACGGGSEPVRRQGGIGTIPRDRRTTDPTSPASTAPAWSMRSVRGDPFRSRRRGLRSPSGLAHAPRGRSPIHRRRQGGRDRYTPAGAGSRRRRGAVVAGLTALGVLDELRLFPSAIILLEAAATRRCRVGTRQLAAAEVVRRVDHAVERQRSLACASEYGSSVDHVDEGRGRSAASRCRSRPAGVGYGLARARGPRSIELADQSLQPTLRPHGRVVSTAGGVTRRSSPAWGCGCDYRRPAMRDAGEAGRSRPRFGRCACR